MELAIAYLPNEETPFTGRAQDFHDNGQKKKETNYKDGEPYGTIIIESVSVFAID